MKKRKILSRLFVLIIGLFIIAGYATVSEAAASAGDFSYEESEAVIQIKKYNGISTEVDISEVFPDAEEITIASYAFSGKAVTRVVLPASVVSVGERAFRDCTSLQTVTFAPKSRTLVLGKGVFEGCKSLTGLEIPDCVSVIPERLCYGCSSLGSVILPEVCNSIGTSAFMNCGSLESIQIPGNCTSIKNSAFSYCKFLSSVVFAEPENGSRILSIGTNVFSGCKMLINISLPEGCTNIPASAFSNCTSLKNVEIPDTCTEVSDQAFSGCTGLYIVTFLNPDTSIGTNAFPEVGKTPNLVIYCDRESSVSDFAKNKGINYKTDVESITLTKLPKVTEYMYSENGTLDLIGMEVEAKVISETSDTGFVVENVEPAKCTITGFDSMKPGIQTITVAYAGEKDSFEIKVYCNLEEVAVTTDSAVYTGKAIEPSFAVYGDETGKQLKPNTDYICTYQNNIDVGTATVKLVGIGQYKGEKTVSFQIVPRTISEKNTIVIVAAMTYTGSQLKPIPEVTCQMKALLPDIDYVVTYGDNKNVGKGFVIIEGIGNYDGSIKKWFDICAGFAGNESGEKESEGDKDESTITEGNPSGNIGKNDSGSTDGNKTPAASVKKPEKGKTYIYKNMYYKVTGSSSVTFMKPVNRKVKKIIIPFKVKILGKSFKVTKINKRACYGCNKINSVSIGNYVTTIGDEAFAKCSRLQNVTIGKGLKKIGKKAFYKDKQLKRITIKSVKLTTVGKGALKGTKKVKIEAIRKKCKAYKRLFSKAK